MSQNRKTGAEANEFGKRMAGIVAEKIGAERISPGANEFQWGDKRITIRSAHKNNSYVGVLSNMLARVDAVLAALELNVRNEFQVWELDRETYQSFSKPQVKNPDIAQVSKKHFVENGDLIAKVRDCK